MPQATVSDATDISTSQKYKQELGDLLLLEMRPGYVSTIRNLSAREALSRAAKREISGDDYGEVKERLAALDLVHNGLLSAARIKNERKNKQSRQ
jgi:hypothetical protein